MARVRVLTHSKRLDDCFGDILVRVVCDCVRIEALSYCGSPMRRTKSRKRGDDRMKSMAGSTCTYSSQGLR